MNNTSWLRFFILNTVHYPSICHATFSEFMSSQCVTLALLDPHVTLTAAQEKFGSVQVVYLTNVRVGWCSFLPVV